MQTVVTFGYNYVNRNCFLPGRMTDIMTVYEKARF